MSDVPGEIKRGKNTVKFVLKLAGTYTDSQKLDFVGVKARTYPGAPAYLHSPFPDRLAVGVPRMPPCLSLTVRASLAGRYAPGLPHHEACDRDGGLPGGRAGGALRRYPVLAGPTRPSFDTGRGRQPVPDTHTQCHLDGSGGTNQQAVYFASSADNPCEASVVQGGLCPYYRVMYPQHPHEAPAPPPTPAKLRNRCALLNPTAPGHLLVLPTCPRSPRSWWRTLRTWGRWPCQTCRARARCRATWAR